MQEQSVESVTSTEPAVAESSRRVGDYALPSPSAAAKSAKRDDSETNIKETIESILVAFIFAFIFRAFVVEAFVIPTGSMAPTLLGAHVRLKCDDCGYEFDVNYSGINEGDDVVIPHRAGPIAVERTDRAGNKFIANYEDKVYAFHCPNCGYRVPRKNPGDPDNAATNPPVCYGDRILVLKYLYLLQEPRRWDVVVFKAPAQPQQYDYSQNYIKRLVGKPGETLMVLDGDIYTSASDKKLEDLTPDDFQVQRKPRDVQNALWRIAYDNDFFPQARPRLLVNAKGEPVGSEPAWMQPWKPSSGESGWDLGSTVPAARTFRFENATGGASLEFDPEANPKQHSLSDWLAYDVTVDQGPEGRPDTYQSASYQPDNNVSDVKLQFFYDRTAGEGPLRIELTKLGRVFIAELTPGKATLYERGANEASETIVQSAAIDQPRQHRPLRVEFMNVDYRVALRIEGKEVITHEYDPNVKALLDAYERQDLLPKANVSIRAERQSCALAHISLWRDIYYGNRTARSEGSRPLPWGSPANFPLGEHTRNVTQLVRLSKDDYFVCGDNSRISGDARYWQDRIHLPNEDLTVDSGRVPRRFMLGRAFFVYWPAGFRPFESAPSVVPNFGDMRFIH